MCTYTYICIYTYIFPYTYANKYAYIYTYPYTYANNRPLCGTGLGNVLVTGDRKSVV